jgi:hypothetical protein
MTKKRKQPRNATKLPRSLKRMFPSVTECYDADRAVEVEVKQVDVKNSVSKDPTKCAVARAFQRETHVESAIIGLSYSYLIKGKTAVRFKTPESVRTELVSFDRHGDFDAGRYYLTPPEPSGRLGASRSGLTAPNASHAAKRRIHKTGRVRVLESGSGY